METKNDNLPLSSLATEAKAVQSEKVSPMSEQLMGEIYDKLVFYLEQKQVYLDQHLTLAKLSAMVGTNSAYLSNTVNQRFGCNLPTLINRYRIERAKQLMDQGNLKVKANFVVNFAHQMLRHLRNPVTTLRLSFHGQGRLRIWVFCGLHIV